MRVWKFLLLIFVIGTFVGCSKDEDSSGRIVINGTTYPIQQAFQYTNGEDGEYENFMTFVSNGLNVSLEEHVITKIEGTGYIGFIGYASTEAGLTVGTHEEVHTAIFLYFENSEYDGTFEISTEKVDIKKSGSLFNVKSDLENRNTKASIRYTGKFKKGILGA
jgi:hypothetical protein